MHLDIKSTKINKLYSKAYNYEFICQYKNLQRYSPTIHH